MSEYTNPATDDIYAGWVRLLRRAGYSLANFNIMIQGHGGLDDGTRRRLVAQSRDIQESIEKLIKNFQEGVQ